MTFQTRGFIETREQVLRRRQLRYEEAIGKYLLRKLGRPDLEREIRAYNRRHLDWGGLCLAGFNDQQIMPLWLVSARIPYLDGVSLTALFKRPGAHPVMQRFAILSHEFRDKAEDGTLALVFQWPAWCKFLLLHTWEMSGCTSSAPRFVWDRGPPHRPFILEPLEVFLQKLRQPPQP